MKGEIF